MGLLQEFKQFAMKGNAVDMAVGLILGAAFGKVVSSVVNDLIMPPLGLVMGGVDFKDLRVALQAARPAGVGADGAPTAEVAEVAVRWGQFINITIDFLIVAFAMFMVVKVMNRLIAKRETPAA